MKEQVVYSLIGAFIGGAVVWFVITTALNNNHTGMMQFMGMNSSYHLSTTNPNSVDAHFIEQMIPHHQDAITMAKIAQEKGTHQEVKNLAKNIISSQSKEIYQMENWYRIWFGKDVSDSEDVMEEHGMMNGGSMHMGMMGNTMDIQILENATDFDKSFLKGMIPHHQMAVMMANMLLNSTTRPEMKKLAQDIIDEQSKEINEMRQWYQAWGYAL